jgi:hypothetical protein
MFLVHEPSAETLRQTVMLTVLLSHGLEARSQQMAPVESDLARTRLWEMIIRTLWLWRVMQRW